MPRRRNKMNRGSDLNIMAGISNYEFERSKVRGGFKFISKLSYMNALDLLSRKDPEFLKSFLHVLTKSVQFEAYFFETPPMTEKKAETNTFEFVLLDATEHFSDAFPNPDTFSSHFIGNKDNVAFQNLDDDASLVVPCPQGEEDGAYTHLAIFVRYGPEEQVQNFWQMVGDQMLNRLVSQDGKTVWMSTFGSDVHWIHMRLDSSPKYYSHQSYKLQSGGWWSKWL